MEKNNSVAILAILMCYILIPTVSVLATNQAEDSGITVIVSDDNTSKRTNPILSHPGYYELLDIIFGEGKATRPRFGKRSKRYDWRTRIMSSSDEGLVPQTVDQLGENKRGIQPTAVSAAKLRATAHQILQNILRQRKERMLLQWLKNLIMRSQWRDNVRFLRIGKKDMNALKEETNEEIKHGRENKRLATRHIPRNRFLRIGKRQDNMLKNDE